MLIEQRGIAPVQDDAAITAEKKLAQLIACGDEAAVMAWASSGHAQDVEFTGRTFAAAICQGMTQASCLLAREGFNLCVTDDAAAQRAIAAANGMRGLLGFLERYRYCKAQRSYYLPVVQSSTSLQSIKALLGAGLLGKRDAAELLSLSLRMNKASLACVLADGGAKLATLEEDDIPPELSHGSSKQAADDAQGEASLWARFATPQRDIDTLELILHHVEDTPCGIYRSWWGSYARQEGFAVKLAVIAETSDASHCDCPYELTVAFVDAGRQEALEGVLGWNALASVQLGELLERAQQAGRPQAAAAIMRAMHTQPSTLAPLEL